MTNIQYIDLVTSNLETYRIEKDNILEYDLITKEEVVDLGANYAFHCKALTNLVDSLLLVIKDYHKIISLDNEYEFEPDSFIYQIDVVDEENNALMVYVDMTEEEFNENQFNLIDEDKLFITIENRGGDYND